ncbi:MAG: preprotein translocase subunit YajC [Tissierellia bacterium]|nr:preprotein translocase subunit YajC [Tissierellia bacterium]
MTQNVALLAAVPSQNIITSVVLPLVAMIAVFYFGIIRPNKKKEKAAEDMRDNLKVGDEIITIGGMTGKIIQVKEDVVVFETTGMKTRIELMKWGIQQVTKEKNKKEVSSSKTSKEDEASEVREEEQ